MARRRPRFVGVLRAFASMAFALVHIGLASSAQAQGPAPSLDIDAYGEILYQRFDYGPNQNLPNGSEPDSRATMDLRRFNLSFTSVFDEGLTFKVEIEFEHGGTGSALELEYEEFGEYEFEVEKGGEVQLEQLHLTKVFSPAFALQAGQILVPVGLTNIYHNPVRYLGAVRPESESELIPLTWQEMGLAAFGRIGRLNYRVQAVNALNSTGFSSRNWIVEGKQQKFEAVKATDLALAGQIEYVGVPGLVVGASGYRGNTTGNRPKEDMEDVAAPVTIGAVHASYRTAALIARAGYLYGTLENADVVSARNASLSRNIQSPRTPVARAARGWGVEVGYDVANLVAESQSFRLIPFLRYEAYDPMHQTDEAVFDVPRFDNSVLTFGANVFVSRGVVVKADYAMRTVGRGRYRDENTFSIALAFARTLFTGAQPAAPSQSGTE